MKYFVLLLLLVSSCKNASRLCPMEKGYAKKTYRKYGHIKFKVDSLEANNPSKTDSLGGNNKRRGYYIFSDSYQLTKFKRRSLSRLLRFYDTCRTQIKDVHVYRHNRILTIAYNEKGDRTYKRIGWQHKNKIKTIRWNEEGKRTVTIEPSHRPMPPNILKSGSR